MIKNMKKGLFLLLSMTLCYLSMAQVPNSFSYQMVIRNGNNELVANTTVGIRIGLLGGNAADTLWYEEEHKVKTNLNGLAYITIGKGNILKGAVSTIDWTRGPFFIKSETDPTGGTNYSLIIVSQMLSVPYAIYAKTAEKLSVPVTESDPLFSKSIAKGITAEDTARWSKREVIDGNSGGGGVVFEIDPVFNTSVAKSIRSVDTASWNNKLNLRDTLSMLRPYLRAADTASLSNRLNQKVDLNQLNTNTLTLDGKINIADTANMMANYRTGINSKVNIADTALMLTPYLRSLDTSSMLLPYLLDADTVNMLANYRTGINSKVNIADTALMLLPYLRGADTSAMLANYRRDIGAKVNIADTASMLTPYLRSLDTSSMLLPYLMDADTLNMLTNYRAGINAKVNIADTSNMLLPYLRDADTTSMLLHYLLDADTTAMLANYRTGINAKVNIADTLNMLANYRTALNLKAPLASPTFTGTVSGIDKIMVGLVNVDNTTDASKPVSSATQTALNIKVNISDTTSMLSTYLRKADAIISDLQNQVALLVGLTALVDIDGNNYSLVKIGNQIWMKENLKVSRYRNGDLIPVVTDNSSWSALGTGGRSWYSNDSTTYENPYGNLYNWYAVNDSRKLCPLGWHVPIDAEWTTLTDFLGGMSVAGGKMKSTGTTYWTSESAGIDNSSGFSALPGGYRNNVGSFIYINTDAFFWSATPDTYGRAWFRNLSHNFGSVYNYDYLGNYGLNQSFGASVRCLRD